MVPAPGRRAARAPRREAGPQRLGRVGARVRRGGALGAVYA